MAELKENSYLLFSLSCSRVSIRKK